jgi:hypothetical protein
VSDDDTTAADGRRRAGSPLRPDRGSGKQGRAAGGPASGQPGGPSGMKSGRRLRRDRLPIRRLPDPSPRERDATDLAGEHDRKTEGNKEAAGRL